MRPKSESPYADVAIELQLSRCAFTALALGKALLSFPADLEGTAKELDALEKTIKWHNMAAGEIRLHSEASRVGKANSLAIAQRMKKLDRLSRGIPCRWLALLWCGVLLLWDCRVTCPGVARTGAWHRLDQASERLARSLSKRHPEAEELATKMYEELAW